MKLRCPICGEEATVGVHEVAGRGKVYAYLRFSHKRKAHYVPVGRAVELRLRGEGRRRTGVIRAIARGGALGPSLLLNEGTAKYFVKLGAVAEIRLLGEAEAELFEKCVIPKLRAKRRTSPA